MVDVWSLSIKCEKWGLKWEFGNDISSLTRYFSMFSNMWTNAVLWFFGGSYFHPTQTQTKPNKNLNERVKWCVCGPFILIISSFFLQYEVLLQIEFPLRIEYFGLKQMNFKIKVATLRCLLNSQARNFHMHAMIASNNKKLSKFSFQTWV